MEVNGLVWGKGENQLTASVVIHENGEQVGYKITLLDSSGAVVTERTFTVDMDMFGSGFVKAAQLDKDHQLEVLVWGRHEWKQSYLLDYRDGEMHAIAATDVTGDIADNIKELTEQWTKVEIENVMTNYFSVALFLIYYVLLAILWIVIALIRRHRIKKQAGTA